MNDAAPSAEPRSPRPFAKTEQVLTTMTPTDRERLDAYANEHLMSRAEAVRSFVRDGLDRAEASSS